MYIIVIKSTISSWLLSKKKYSQPESFWFSCQRKKAFLSRFVINKQTGLGYYKTNCHFLHTVFWEKLQSQQTEVLSGSHFISHLTPQRQDTQWKYAIFSNNFLADLVSHYHFLLKPPRNDNGTIQSC